MKTKAREMDHGILEPRARLNDPRRPAQVLHFGGNGHAEVRLERARAALARRPGAPSLVDVPYPGFEGRPRAESLDAFLDAVGRFCRAGQGSADPPAATIATGIGALVALSLRAEGELRMPLILQGPVLWGLERRFFPRLLRWRPAQLLAHRLLGLPGYQDRFARGQFLRPVDDAWRDRFFEGYARCSAFGDLFRWFTPPWLRVLERRFAARPGALEAITVWVGGRDRVVDRREVEVTEQALGVPLPLVLFPGWGHYPMIDEPEEWADALCDAMEDA